VDDDPFAALGLPARAGLTDDDVRAAWRRVAAATHPDREDGGDPVRFGAAAAGYATLRTSFGRGEALADLGAGGSRPRGRRQARPGAHRASAHEAGARRNAGWPSRAWPSRAWPSRGWPNVGAWAGARRVHAGAGAGAGPAAVRGRWLTLPVAGAAVPAAAAVAAVGLTPATIGLLAGALTVTGWALWRRGGWGR